MIFVRISCQHIHLSLDLFSIFSANLTWNTVATHMADDSNKPAGSAAQRSERLSSSSAGLQHVHANPTSLRCVGEAILG